MEVKSDADRMLAGKNKTMDQIESNSQGVIDSIQSTLNSEEQEWCCEDQEEDRGRHEWDEDLTEPSQLPDCVDPERAQRGLYTIHADEL